MGFCPGFWDWLDSSYDAGKISSISLVYKELVDFGDELSKWAKERQNHFLSVDDANTPVSYTHLTLPTNREV